MIALSIDLRRQLRIERALHEASKMQAMELLRMQRIEELARIFLRSLKNCAIELPDKFVFDPIGSLIIDGITFRLAGAREYYESLEHYPDNLYKVVMCVIGGPCGKCGMDETIIRPRARQDLFDVVTLLDAGEPLPHCCPPPIKAPSAPPKSAHEEFGEAVTTYLQSLGFAMED